MPYWNQETQVKIYFKVYTTRWDDRHLLPGFALREAIDWIESVFHHYIHSLTCIQQGQRIAWVWPVLSNNKDFQRQLMWETKGWYCFLISTIIDRRWGGRKYALFLCFRSLWTYDSKGTSNAGFPCLPVLDSTDQTRVLGYGVLFILASSGEWVKILTII